MVLDEPKEFVKFLARHRLTSDQFLFMFLIYKEEYEALYQYTEQVKGLPPAEINDLVRRGYMINENQRGQYFADGFIITDKFSSEVFSMIDKAAEEFWETYPLAIYVDGKRFSAKTADKADLCDRYNKKIGYSVRKHKKVMEALRYGIQHNLINMGIEKWFRSEQWKQLEEEMKLTQNLPERYGDKEF